jgi:hypothetical protein
VITLLHLPFAIVLHPPQTPERSSITVQPGESKPSMLIIQGENLVFAREA